MPTGKEPYRGALLDRIPLGRVEIHEGFLKEARLAQESFPWDDPGSGFRDQIREALERYFAAHIGTPPITRTERAPHVRAFADAVESYLRDGPSPLVVESLCRHLTQLGWTWRDQLDRHLRAAEREGRLPPGSARSFLGWPAKVAAAVKREGLDLTDRVGSALPWPHEGEACLQEVLSFCCAPSPGRRWRDPFLPHLISDLAPLWARLTERSLLAKDADDVCLFGGWVQRLVNSARVTVEQELKRRAETGGWVPSLSLAVTPSAVRHVLRTQRAVT